MGRYGPKRRGSYYAGRHIEEARRLSAEVGGADSDVKAYFFGLGGEELRLVLAEYGRRYGERTRQYALATLADWRSGRRQMSGLVAERLFNLLPPLMPLEVKYDLVRRLWESIGPTSHGRIVIGPDCDPEAASAEVERRILRAVSEYRISEPLARRFAWLSAGDVEVQQTLLNHFLAEERALIVSDARTRTQMILTHLTTHGRWTERIRQEYRIGKHTLEIVFEPRAKEFGGGESGIVVPTPGSKPTMTRTQAINPWLVLIAFMVGMLLAQLMIR